MYEKSVMVVTLASTIAHGCSRTALGLPFVRQQVGKQALQPEEFLAFSRLRFTIGASIEELDPGCFLIWFHATPGHADVFVEDSDGFVVLLGGGVGGSDCGTDEEVVYRVRWSFLRVEV